MSHGPLIFLGVLAAFVASWWGLIFAPHLQIGSQLSAQVDAGVYPTPRPGVAAQGRDVYVANGCVHCHSQQVRQDNYTFELILTRAGSNAAAVSAILGEVVPNLNVTELLAKASDKSPQTVLKDVPQSAAEDAQKRLKKAGAAAQVVFIPLGADIDRGWGVRRNVAADYLYDYPVQVGNSRLGPDLSNIGARMPDPLWHLDHLYDPRTRVNGSIMPAYRYLFETRPIGKQPSPQALKLTEKFAPKPGYEVVPTAEALQLVAYLQSLRADIPLFEGPMTQLAPPPAPAGTNVPGATNVLGATNASAANAPKP